MHTCMHAHKHVRTHAHTHTHLPEAGWKQLEVLGVRDREKVSLEPWLEGRQNLTMLHKKNGISVLRHRPSLGVDGKMPIATASTASDHRPVSWPLPCLLWPGDGQAAGPERRVWGDDAEEEGPGGQHRPVLQEAGPRREADWWPGRREGPLDGGGPHAGWEVHQHPGRRVAVIWGGGLPGRLHCWLQTGGCFVLFGHKCLWAAVKWWSCIDLCGTWICGGVYLWLHSSFWGGGGGGGGVL